MKYLLTGFGDEAGTTIEEQMTVLKKNEVRYIELRGVDGKHILDFDHTALNTIKHKMNRGGFTASAIGSSVGKSPVTAPFDDAVNQFQRAIYCAKLFGCRYIRAFSFYPPENEPREAYWGEAVRRVRVLVSLAEERGLIFALENESGIYTDTLEACLRMFEEINSDSFRMAFDPGNFIREGVQPYPKAYEALRRHIGYFHIKDAKGKRFVPAGEGDADMAGMLKTAYKEGFNGFLSLEPHLAYMTELTREQQFTKACNALKMILNENFDARLSLIEI